MDILAHGLWAGAAVKACARRHAITRETALWTLALAILPDFGHALPVAVWTIASGTPHLLYEYAFAPPGGGPPLPDTVALWSHHLHCMLHSGPVAGAFTLVATLALGHFWLPLAGWWSHVLIDVLAHSTNFYPSPVLYPFSYWGFDGFAWNTWPFQIVNYLMLAWTWALLLRR